MRLKDMKRSRSDNSPYLGTLTDVTGATHYEIAISGATKLIQNTFGEVEFQYQIDPHATDADWIARYQKMWARQVGDAAASETHETTAALTKKGPPPSTAQNSIVVSVRRTQGKGTWWAFAFPPFPMAVRTNVFFTLPPICNCSGIVAPLSGDADLFLSANGPRNPVIAASTRGVGQIDLVSFGPAVCWPWQEFVPWFRVNAFTTCVTSFAMSGFGVFP